MRTTNKQRQQLFRRVRDFLRATPVASDVAPVLLTLEGIIGRLEEHAAQQDHRNRQSRSGTKLVQGRARALRSDFMRPIALIARSIFTAQGAEGEAIRRAVIMPRTQDYEGLVAAAQGMMRLVTEHEERFVAAGLPKGHLARLTAAADDIKVLVDTRSVAFGRRSAATSGAKAEAKEGFLTVRILDALVTPALRDDPARLAEWRAVTAMSRSGGARGGAVVGEIASPVAEQTSGGETRGEEVKAA